MKKTDKEVVENIEENEIIREVIVERKSGFNYAEVIVIMIISLIIGIAGGSFITHITKKPISNTNPTISEVPDELVEFVSTYHDILSNYYEAVDSKELLDAGINGMLEYLDDDYSFYMNQEQTENFNEQVEGKYTGIGVEIIMISESEVRINRVFENTPADKAGLKAGDVFVSINGEDVSKLDASSISAKIKGSKKEVKIGVKRDDETKEFTVKIDQVEIESVNSEIIEKNDKKIGYLSISVFASNTYNQFEKKLLELEGKNIDSLIIDVRGNSGGYLSTVTDMVSLFLNKSKIIYQLDTKGIVEQIYSNSNTSRSYKVAVLIDNNSASASEILAAAMKESYGATIVGVNSFGKGTVQKAYQLESGATVKYTVQKWLTPNGNWINKVGVEPDVKVELSSEYLTNPVMDNDNQLQAAISELSK